VFSTACLSAALEPNLELSVVYPRIPVLLPVRVRRGPLPESVRVLLVGTGILELLGCLALADRGVLSVDELLSVRGLPPGVEVFLGTLEPNPTGVGRMPRAPDRILLDLRTFDPRLPSLSSLFRDMLEPCRLGGLEPGLEPGVREFLPIELD